MEQQLLFPWQRRENLHPACAMRWLLGRTLETTEPGQFFTVAKRGWRLTPEEFLNTSPDVLTNASKVDVHRAGGKAASGWLFAGIHGSWDAETSEYQLHLHGIDAGDIIKAVDLGSTGQRFIGRVLERPRDKVGFAPLATGWGSLLNGSFARHSWHSVVSGSVVPVDALGALIIRPTGASDAAAELIPSPLEVPSMLGRGHCDQRCRTRVMALTAQIGRAMFRDDHVDVEP